MLTVRGRPSGVLASVLMNSRIVVFLISAAAIIFACGPRSRATEASATTARRVHRSPGDPVISTDLEVSATSRGIQFALDVSNGGDRLVELTFPSGQDYDFVVQDSLNQRVWQWSEGHMFTQSLHNRVVSAGQTMRFEERWRPRGVHGRYTVIALLKSVNYPLEKRLEFAIP
ncbi:MAG: hypothetical protein NVS4B3_13640 [Gemmatimonadaceae bacterium]